MKRVTSEETRVIDGGYGVKCTCTLCHKSWYGSGSERTAKLTAYLGYCAHRFRFGKCYMLTPRYYYTKISG